MKKNTILFIVTTCALVVGFVLTHGAKSFGNARPINLKGESLGQGSKQNTNASGRSLSEKRLAHLKQMSELPVDASPWDLQLAEQTDWWGKPLDPRAFWKNRTVWLDLRAVRDANRHGRLYPPIPFGDTNFLSCSEKDFAARPGGSEGGVAIYYVNERERTFWSDFERTHPLPPEEIEDRQLEIEGDILSSKHWKGVRQKDVDSAIQGNKQEAISLNYPPEALTDEALGSAYAIHQHQQYQSDIQRMPIEVVQAMARNSGVDLSQVTNAVSIDQIQAANAWRIAYLQRLRRENTDEQYIQAYLQAWNLNSNQVFGSGQ